MSANPHDLGDLRLSGASVLDADVLVIGSGAGGSTVAATAAGLGYSVLILEEGPYVPPGKQPQRMADSFARLWRNGGLTVAYGRPPIAYAEGCCVGGTTEINSAIFQRAPESLLTEWSERYRLHDFGREELAAHYDWAAEAVNATLTPAPWGPPSDILASAGQAMGWKVAELERGQRNVGSDPAQPNIMRSVKQSMSVALLPRLLNQGVRLIAEARVCRLLRRGRLIEGVEAVARDADGRRRRVTIKAGRVFLCAGAIHTPVLLRQAGFRGVIGQRLRVHPTVKCLVQFDRAIDAQDHILPVTAVTQFMPDLRMGGSVFTPATFGMALAEDRQRCTGEAGQLRQSALYYAMVRGSGHGRIIPVKGCAPIVTYALNNKDWRLLSEGVSRLGQAMLATGAKKVWPSVTGHPGWTSPAEAARDEHSALPKNRTQLMSIHLFGSCPIGEDETLCGANSFGQVFGADNLFAADASVIPEAPGVNPQATVMALARRNAFHALGR